MHTAHHNLITVGVNRMKNKTRIVCVKPWKMSYGFKRNERYVCNKCAWETISASEITRYWENTSNDRVCDVCHGIIRKMDDETNA